MLKEILLMYILM